MIEPRMLNLRPTKTSHAQVKSLAEGSWHLEIPADSRSIYRLAQLDDQGNKPRSSFPWEPPLKIILQARLSADNLPGTWGFGLWNEPFSFIFGRGGFVPRLPALPDTAWFFHASPHNYLSFRDDLPACGFLVATFNSAKVPFPLLGLASPLLALTIIPGAAQWVRRLLRRFIRQDATLIHADVTKWHGYSMEWEPKEVRFNLDEREIFRTPISPRGPLSLVIWVDNQYAALPPKGGLKYGSLPNPEPAWLEIRELDVRAN